MAIFEKELLSYDLDKVNDLFESLNSIHEDFEYDTEYIIEKA